MPSNVSPVLFAALSYSSPARHLSPLFLPSSSTGTSDVCTLIELVYRVGWSHLLPMTDNPDAPLPFYRDFLYSYPLDVYLILIAVIGAFVVLLKQVCNLFIGLWNGDKVSRLQQ